MSGNWVKQEMTEGGKHDPLTKWACLDNNSMSESQSVVGNWGSKENRWSDSVVGSIGPAVRVWNVSTWGVQDGSGLGNGEDHGENKLKNQKFSLVLQRTAKVNPVLDFQILHNRLGMYTRKYHSPSTCTFWLLWVCRTAWLLQNQKVCEKCYSKATEMNW